MTTTDWNPEQYATHARFVADLGEPLLDLLAPRPKELILDLGCGDGALTEKLARTGCIAIGVDMSNAQLSAARKRNPNVACMDGQQLAVKRRVDAVFSNAALHWMKDADAVIKGVADCLLASGRFVGEFGGQGNVETIRSCLHEALLQRGINPWQVDPWYFPSPEEYAALLTRYGFTVEYIELIPRPTNLPGDITGWLDVFAQPFTEAVPKTERERLINEVRKKLEPTLRDTNGNWIADYVRLRFQATR